MAGDLDKTLAALRTATLTEPGERVILGRYTLVRELGRGGMGEVWEAKHQVLGSRHAIKILLSRLRGPSSDTLVERFMREARLCVSLRHPNLVLVTDCGIDEEDHPVIVMDLIEGADLGAFTKPGRPMPAPAVVRVGVQASAAVEVLHQRGIVHRDIKPANLMLERSTGRVVLMDLGISRQQSEASDMTLGSIIGTPAYMAPEQAISSSQVGTPADIYSLGATLAAMLMARPPADRGTAHEMIARVRERVYASGSIEGLYKEFANQSPPELLAIIRDATRFNPKDRPDAAQMRDRLAALDLEISKQQQVIIPSQGDLMTLQIALPGGHLTPPSLTPPHLTPPHVTPPVQKPRRDTETFMPPAGMADQPGPAQTVLVQPAPHPLSKAGAKMWLIPVLLLPVVGLFIWALAGRQIAVMPEVPRPVVPPVQPVSSPEPQDASPVAPAPIPSTDQAWPAKLTLRLPGDETLELLLVRPGSTRLGNDDVDRPHEHPRTTVTFTAPRWMGRFEVTCGQYASFLAADPAAVDPGLDQFVAGPAGVGPRAGFARFPVRGVNLADARAFCRWLSGLAGSTVRLPGEVEWEYAARGPAARTWPWGDTWRPEHARSDGHNQPVAVGSSPTGISWCGLEDLAGNVFEWTEDWFDETRWTSLSTRDPRPDPATQSDGLTVVRGGCFANPRTVCRTSTRIGVRSDKRDAAIGFRVIVESPPPTSAVIPGSPVP